MEPTPVTPEVTLDFLRQLGARCEFEVSLYLLGGSALALLGNPRQTQDLDYTADIPPEQLQAFRLVADALASEMRLDVSPKRVRPRPTANPSHE